MRCRSAAQSGEERHSRIASERNAAPARRIYCGVRRIVTLLVCSAACAAAQTISFGVLGGAPFTDVVQNTTINGLAVLPKSTNFVLGPTVQINLPLSLRFEIDALYRPYSFSATNAGAATNVSAQQWQFPFLLQYRFKTPLLKPFVEAGLAFDHLANVSAAAANITSGPAQLVRQSNADVVLGAGVDAKIPFIRLSGELRYIHQGSADFRQISKLNQAEFLFGIHF
jgi:hypothetical protein